MTRAKAFAKINLALVVGPRRGDGKHEVVTVLQRIDLHDEVALEPATHLVVEGYAGDTIVRGALLRLARAAGVDPAWRVRIEKRIPVAAGLGGGSTDAASALRLANELLPVPLPVEELHRVAAAVGADVPFFLRAGAQLATGDGTSLERVDLPSEYAVLLVVPHDAAKESTRSVYEAFDARSGDAGFAARADELRRSLAAVESARDLDGLPPNDLASSAIASNLRAAGAFRADVSGAGPVVYGLFERGEEAERAAGALGDAGRTLVVRPLAAGDLE